MQCTILYGLLDLLFCIIDKCLKMCTMKWTRVAIVKNIIDALLSLMHQRMQQGSKPTGCCSLSMLPSYNIVGERCHNLSWTNNCIVVSECHLLTCALINYICIAFAYPVVRIYWSFVGFMVLPDILCTDKKFIKKVHDYFLYIGIIYVHIMKKNNLYIFSLR